MKTWTWIRVFLLVGAIGLSCFASNQNVYAYEGARHMLVIMDGELIDLYVDPEVYEDQLYLPIRNVADQLGIHLQYENNELSFNYNDQLITHNINTNVFFIDGKKDLYANASIIRDDRILLSTDAIAGLLKYDIVQDGDRTVFLDNSLLRAAPSDSLTETTNNNNISNDVTVTILEDSQFWKGDILIRLLDKNGDPVVHSYLSSSPREGELVFEVHGIIGYTNRHGIAIDRSWGVDHTYEIALYVDGKDKRITEFLTITPQTKIITIQFD